MAKLFANSEDPDQMPHSAMSDLGLHCLPITLLRVSRLQRVKHNISKSSVRKNVDKPKLLKNKFKVTVLKF